MPAGPNDHATKVLQLQEQATKVLEDQMCFVCDWFDDDLPMENKDGNAMDSAVQGMLDTIFTTNKYLEHFEKPQTTVVQLPAAPLPGKESVLVFTDKGGYCAGMLDNAPPERIGHKKIINEAPGSLSQEIVQSLLKPGWDLVIFGCGLDSPASNGVVDIHDFQADVARLYLYILQAMNKEEDCVKKVAILTRGIFSDDSALHETVGVGIATHGTLFGMTNTARLELPTAAFQVIDTEYCLSGPAWEAEAKHSILPKLASEVFRNASFGHNTVRLLRKGRYVLRQRLAQEYEAANCDFALPEVGGVIAITGGSGSLALVMAEWLLGLADKHKATGFTLKLLSRSAKVGEQNLPTWKRIQDTAAKLGIFAEQSICDVSSELDCDRFVRDNSPHLAGIIHSAGILVDSILPNQTWEKFEQSWAAKSRAALYLHYALERSNNPNFSFFWMFSSTSVYGNPGQLNYGGSNSFLDALCRHRRARGLPGCAMQWGPWGEVGMASTLDEASKRRFALGIQPPFTTKAGLRGLEAGLRTGLPGFTVYKVGAQATFKQLAKGDTATECYMRNFQLDYIPIQVAPTLDRQNLYTLYALLREGYFGGSKKRLLLEHFVQPLVEDDIDSNWW